MFSVNDTFSIGSSESMDIVCNLYNRLDEYLNKYKKPFHPETLHCFNMELNNLNIRRDNYLDIEILREEWIQYMA